MSKLNIRRKQFAKEVVKTGNQTKAYKKVYGVTDDNYAKKAGSRLMTFEDVKENVLKRLEMSKITPKLVYSRLREGLDATETKVFNDKDEGIVVSEPLIDFNARHKYINTVLVLAKDLKQPGSSQEDPFHVKHDEVIYLPTRNGKTEIEVDTSKLKKCRQSQKK